MEYCGSCWAGSGLKQVVLFRKFKFFGFYCFRAIIKISLEFDCLLIAKAMDRLGRLFSETIGAADTEHINGTGGAGYLA